MSILHARHPGANRTIITARFLFSSINSTKISNEVCALTDLYVVYYQTVLTHICCRV